MSKIAVITACYNSRSFISDAIASVRKQDIPDWEHILVDDGSTDGTAEVVAELAAGDSRIKLLRQANAGTCRARNAGAAHCSPETQYLLFLDHDDALEPVALRKLSEYLDANNQVGVVGCQFQEIDTEGRKIGNKMRSRWVPSRLGLPRPLRADERETPFVAFYCGTGQGPFAMFRRSIFEQVDGWTTEFWPYEDSDLFCKIALISIVHYLPDRLYLKRAHVANALLDAPRVERAYHAFRRKWDEFEPRNPNEAALLAAAGRFYRTSFRPCRDLRVGAKAAGEFVRKPSVGKLRWAMRLFASGVRGLVSHNV